MTRPIPQELQESVKALFCKNYSRRAVQKIFPDLSLSLLSRCRMKFFGNAVRPEPGKPRKISTQNMTYIRGNLRNGNLDGPRSVQCYLTSMGAQMSLRNIRYQLKHEGFKAKRKVRTNFVSKDNRKKRLAWAKMHCHLTADDWHKWEFSDEIRVNMRGSDGKSFYWTDRPSRLMSHQTEAQVQGTVNSDVYTEIPGSSLLDTMEYFGLDKKTFRFQQDNASPHTSGLTKKRFKRHGFSLEIVLDWPAQTPDLNPTEQTWHQLIKRRLNTYDTRATTTLELEKRIEKEWYKFTEEDCSKYIDSMPSRIRAAVIKSNNGEPIRY